jgi:hypothetical protein
VIGPDSRYAEGSTDFSSSHSYDSDRHPVTDDETGELTVRSHSTVYLLTTLPLPPPPRVQVMVRETDNMPLLAHEALNDPTKWWVLADANPQVRHPFDLRTADVIYLPT